MIKHILLYILIAYLISFSYIYFIYKINMLYNYTIALVMFSPLFAAFVSFKIFYKNKTMKDFLNYIAANINEKSFLIGIISSIILGVVYIFNLFIFYKLGFYTIKQIPIIKNAPEYLNILLLLRSLLFGTAITIIFTFGEEAGWRGFLYRELKNKTNNIIILSIIIGIIWSFWHFPLLYLDKWTFPTVSLFERCLLFTVLCILLTFVLIELREASNSIIPCAILHAFVNNIVVVAIFFIQNFTPFGVSGAPFLIAVAITYFIIKILLNKLSFLKINESTS